jgi:hypothetical protein
MTITPASGAQVTRMVAARARVGDGTMQSFEDRHRPANHKIVAIQRAPPASRSRMAASTASSSRRRRERSDRGRRFERIE